MDSKTPVSILHKGQLVDIGHLYNGAPFKTYGPNGFLDNDKTVAYCSVTKRREEFWTRGAAEYWLKTHAVNNLH